MPHKKGHIPWNKGLKTGPSWNKGLTMPPSWGAAVRVKHLGEPGQEARTRVLITYRYRARKLGLIWELTKEQFYHLIRQNCFYCGSPPSNVQKASHDNGDCVYTGIDRKSNDQGYVLKNCVPCCVRCNLAKRKMSLDEFVEWVKNVYTHLRGKLI